MNPSSDYSEKLGQELSNYNNVGIVHELPPIYHYWSNKYLSPKLASFGFPSIEDFFVSYIWRRCREITGTVCEIVSLGSGNCDFEIGLARRLREQGVENFRFVCLEINETMLGRGKQLANESSLLKCFRFEPCDLNEWAPDTGIGVAMANHSLHHIVALESVFDNVSLALESGGTFLIHDMIGRNGHMRWPEALEVVQAFWKYLPRSHKYNHQLRRLEDEFVNWDCSNEGFEGIRAQDILPELIKRFEFDLFLGFCNVIDVFIDRGFGPNFDVNSEWDRLCIDRIHAKDEQLLESGQVKPTHMLAALVKGGAQPKNYKHLTPAFCTRWP